MNNFRYTDDELAMAAVSLLGKRTMGAMRPVDKHRDITIQRFTHLSYPQYHHAATENAVYVVALDGTPVHAVTIFFVYSNTVWFVKRCMQSQGANKDKMQECADYIHGYFEERGCMSIHMTSRFNNSPEAWKLGTLTVISTEEENEA